MADESETPNTTPMDHNVDRAVKPQEPAREKYSASGENSPLIAETRSPLSDTEPSKLTSWTMREIERMIANDVLKSSRKSTDEFATDLNNKYDFRLKNLSRQLGVVLQRDRNYQTIKGKLSKPIGGIDLQSQTMRMVTANAALGTYQFQKNMVLPYMRKSLALGYQKVTLLKEVVSGITSMEKAVVTKLEAIKLNTAASAPRKSGFFKTLMKETRLRTIRRIAGNISDFMVDGWDEKYRKYITPYTKALNKKLSDTGQGGGLMGVRRSVLGSMNKLRRSIKTTAEKDVEGASRFDKIKTRTAKVGNKVLTGAIKLGQKARLGEERNRSISKFLQPHAESLARFNPFSGANTPRMEIEERDGYVDPNELKTHTNWSGDSAYDLNKSFVSWKTEYKTYTEKSLSYLASIDRHIQNCCNGSGEQNKGKKKRYPTVDPLSKPYRKDKTKSGIDAAIESKKTITTIKKNIEPRTTPVTTIGSSLKKMREDNLDTFTGFTTSLKKALAPLYHKSYTDSITPKLTLATATGIPLTAPPMQSSEIPDRSFFRDMFTSLESKVSKVSDSVSDGNRARSKFETLQMKWRDLADRLRKQGTRKNSYADKLEQREKQKSKRPGFLSRAKNRLGAPTLGAMGELMHGNVAGALLGLGGTVTQWALGEILSLGLAGAKKALPLLLKGVFKGGGLLLKGGAKGAGLLLKGGAGAVAKSAAGGLLKGGVSLAKGLGPGLAVGIGADMAQGWFERNTTGATRRVGVTGSEMAKWGAAGATIGSVIPGLGTVAGGAVGAAVGGVIANADLISSGLKKAGSFSISALTAMGSTAKSSGKYLWSSIFGEEAELDKDGKVKKQEKQSLLGNLYSSVYGKKAKYTKDGQIVSPGKEGLVPHIYKGFDRFLFGEKDTKGKYKPGTSLMDGIFDTVAVTMKAFSEKMSSLYDKVSEGLGWVKDAAGNTYQNVKDTLGSGYDWMKNTLDQTGGNLYNTISNVSDAALGKVSSIASSMIGLSETKDNAAVKSYLSKGGKLTSIDPSITAWCAAFVNSTLAQAGIKGTNSLTASSFKSWGKGVDPRQVQSGDVLVEDRGSVPGTSGDHVGIASGEVRQGKDGSLQIEMISGNSGNKVTKKFYDARRLKVRRAITQSASGGVSTDTLPTTQNSPWVKAIQGGVSYQANSKYAGSSPYNFGTSSNIWDSGIPTDSTLTGVGSYATGNGSLGSKSIGGSAKTRFNSAVSYLIKKGWSRVAAIGISANLFGESGLDPSAFNSSGGGDGAKGIAQWRGSRIKDIENRYKRPISSLSLYEQLDAVDHELRDGKHVTNNRAIPNGTADIVQALNSSPDFESVVRQMVYRYERPSTSNTELNRESNKRIELGYSLVGGMGTDNRASGGVSKPDTSKKVRTAEAQTPKTTASPQKKQPEQKAKVAKKEVKTETPSWGDSLTSAVTSLSSSIEKMWSGSPEPSKTTKTNIVSAPIVSTGAKSTPVTSTASMAKRTVRTGA